MEGSSLIAIETVGRPMDIKLLNTILILACDVVVKGRSGAKFNVYGICTGEMTVDPMEAKAGYIPESGGEYRAQGSLEYPDNSRTTFVFFLPKEARMMQPLIESFEETTEIVPDKLV